MELWDTPTHKLLYWLSIQETSGMLVLLKTELVRLLSVSPQHTAITCYQDELLERTVWGRSHRWNGRCSICRWITVCGSFIRNILSSSHSPSIKPRKQDPWITWMLTPFLRNYAPYIRSASVYGCLWITSFQGIVIVAFPNNLSGHDTKEK